MIAEPLTPFWRANVHAALAVIDCFDLAKKSTVTKDGLVLDEAGEPLPCATRSFNDGTTRLRVTHQVVAICVAQYLLRKQKRALAQELRALVGAEGERDIEIWRAMVEGFFGHEDSLAWHERLVSRYTQASQSGE